MWVLWEYSVVLIPGYLFGMMLGVLLTFVNKMIEWWDVMGTLASLAGHPRWNPGPHSCQAYCGVAPAQGHLRRHWQTWSSWVGVLSQPNCDYSRCFGSESRYGWRVFMGFQDFCCMVRYGQDVYLSNTLPQPGGWGSSTTAVADRLAEVCWAAGWFLWPREPPSQKDSVGKAQAKPRRSKRG